MSRMAPNKRKCNNEKRTQPKRICNVAKSINCSVASANASLVPSKVELANAPSRNQRLTMCGAIDVKRNNDVITTPTPLHPTKVVDEVIDYSDSEDDDDGLLTPPWVIARRKASQSLSDLYKASNPNPSPNTTRNPTKNPQ
jgi:hypothetical protein